VSPFSGGGRRSAAARLLGWRRVPMRRRFRWPPIVTRWSGSFARKWGRVRHRPLAKTAASQWCSPSDGGAGDDCEENWRYVYSGRLRLVGELEEHRGACASWLGYSVEGGKRRSGRSPASLWSGKNGGGWSSSQWPKMEERRGCPVL
jgi:hypothetical protein